MLAAGCAYTSQVAPDTVEKANAEIARSEQEKTPQMSDEEKQRLAHLFTDNPAYVALALGDDKDAKLPRQRSSVPPKYPFGLWVTDAKAIIKVAFVISESGAVEDARVYEASDSRFSEHAVAAVRAWTFYPGSKEGAPAKFLFVVPIQFDGRKK
jgi:TonB family protein